jgi:hypothetical protein
MNEFFDHMSDLWVAAAKERGASIAKPALNAQVALELLELARVAAHTQERRFAPLASYLAGVAAERLRTSQPADDAEIAALIQEVRKALEKESPPTAL